MRHVLLLAGGQGKRFWPRSRRAHPKQFMAFDGRRSLLRITSDRLLRAVPIARQWVITHRDYVSRVVEELPGIDPRHVIGEPRGLNTAPAIGLAAELMRREDPDALMLVQAADHFIRDVPRFRALVGEGFRHVAAARDALLIGFKPTRPATGYGYIELGRAVKAPRGFREFEVAAYREKPEAKVAARWASDGKHLWNGCMFFWHAATIRAGIDAHLPALARGLARAARSLDAGRPVDAVVDALYRRQAAVSIEHGVVEKLGHKVALEGDCGWEDVGTWGALLGLLPRDAGENVVQGGHLGIDTRRSLVLSDGGLVVTVGVHDLIVVRHGDAVLVMDRAREDEMRRVVEMLEAEARLRKHL